MNSISRETESTPSFYGQVNFQNIVLFCLGVNTVAIDQLMLQISHLMISGSPYLIP